MIRKKEQKYIITFHTTAEAIALEKACKEDGIPGRLIPVPRQISSGCGLAFSMPAEWKEQMMGYMEKKELHYEAADEYMI